MELSRELSGEAADIFLVPWGSVLVLDGALRGDLEEAARERLAIDRLELLERLKEPQPEDRDLGLDARRYLSQRLAHPS
jgi:hypothetical protein